MKFTPPIESRSTNDLIEIANSNTDEWQQEAIDIAQRELSNRGITKEEQEIKLKKLEAANKAFFERIEKLSKINREKNENESYTLFEKIIIILFATIYKLITKNETLIGPDIWTLKEENYKRKFKQRIYLLLISFLFWSLIIFIIYWFNNNKS